MDRTTVKALRVLEALASSQEPRGVAELGRELGLTQSNTHRILTTLLSQGYVVAHPDVGRYSLSPKMWELGARIIERHPIRRVVGPHLKQLYAQLNETILVAELSGVDVLYIDKLDSDYPVRASARVASRAPAWRTASGRSILAFFKPEDLERYANAAGIEPSKFQQLKQELKDVHQRGYAITIAGTRIGVNSVAAPIWGHGPVPLAGIAVSGPTERFSSERMSSISAAVMNTATRITESLGVSAPVYFDQVPEFVNTSATTVLSG